VGQLSARINTFKAFKAFKDVGVIPINRVLHQGKIARLSDIHGVRVKPPHRTRDLAQEKFHGLIIVIVDIIHGDVGHTPIHRRHRNVTPDVMRGDMSPVRDIILHKIPQLSARAEQSQHMPGLQAHLDVQQELVGDGKEHGQDLI
jgi:hypothetical protein